MIYSVAILVGYLNGGIRDVILAWEQMPARMLLSQRLEIRVVSVTIHVKSWGGGDSIIWNHSCRSEYACYSAKNVVIGPNSCEGWAACHSLKESTVGSNSCQKANSCDVAGAYLSIGDNACNLKTTCYECASGSIVPNGACSTSGADDVQPASTPSYGTAYEQCKYCIVSTKSFRLQKRIHFILLYI
jgi:hypothetical protein